MDAIDDQPVLTPVPLTMRVSIPLDETRLSAPARELAARLFSELPELKSHAYMITNRAVERQTLVSVVESIVHDRLVIGVIVDGPHDESESVIDLGDPHSLRDELAAPSASGRRGAGEGVGDNRRFDIMRIQYLEVVTRDVDAVCAAYASANGVQFGEPEPGCGHARTAKLAGGGLVGVRAPLRESEEPVVRPYWLVHDIAAALAAAVEAGGTVALPAMEIPGHGTCAIYLQGGNDHGLWQL